MGFDIECIIDIHTYPGEYFCPVCRTLVYPNEALQSQCTHLYCKPCLAHVANNTRACPYDGYLVTEADSKLLLESDKALAENIGKVKVRCLYHRSGCSWEGPLSECTSHCSGCAFGNSPVICNRCGVQIVHRQVHDHAQSCPGVYQVQTAGAGQDAASSVSTAVSAAVNQNQATAQSGAHVSQAPNFQSAPASSLPGQDSSQQANASSQAPAATPALVPTQEQWYQQHYQQYYQQYAGYDLYQQAYQQYYPYQQAAVQQYQQNPHVLGQPQNQVYAQPPVQAQVQPQSQSQVQSQPHHPRSQPQTQPQPQQLVHSQAQPVQGQAQVQPQGQPQLHAHVQSLTAQNLNQPHANTQQQLHPAMHSHAQIPSQSNPPHGFAAPQAQHYNQVQQLLMQPQQQQHTQVPQYQQPHFSLQHTQPSHVQFQSHLVNPTPLQPQPHSQIQPQPHLQHHTHPQMRPSQVNQPGALNAPPPSLYSSAHAVTGHQSYPQQPPQQVQLGVLQQNPVHAHPTSGPTPGQIQGHIPQQPGFLGPPMPSQQQAPFPSQSQVSSMPPAQQPQFHPQAQQQSHSIQQHPVIHSSQPSVPQQYVQQQPHPSVVQPQLHQHSHLAQQQPMQSQLRPQGPSHIMQQNSQVYLQQQQNAAVAASLQPQQSQHFVGRPVMSSHGASVQSLPFAQSSGGFGSAALARPAQHGLDQPSMGQNYGNKINNQLQTATEQQLVQSGMTSELLQRQGGQVSDKVPVVNEAGLPSLGVAENVANAHRDDSVGMKTLKSEAGVSYEQEVTEEITAQARQSKTLAKDAESEFCGGKDGSGGPVSELRVKEDSTRYSLEPANGKSVESVIQRDSTGDAHKEESESQKSQKPIFQKAGDVSLQSFPKGSGAVSPLSASKSDGFDKNNNTEGSQQTVSGRDQMQQYRRESQLQPYGPSTQQKSAGSLIVQSLPLAGPPPPGPPPRQIPGLPPSLMGSQGPGLLPQPRNTLNPNDQLQPPLQKQPHDVALSGLPVPGPIPSFGRGPGHFGAPRGPPLPAVDQRDGIMGRAPLHAPEGQFGLQHSGNPVEAEMFHSQRLGRIDIDQSKYSGSFGRPSGEPTSLRMNGVPGFGSVSLGSQDERFKTLPGEHLNPFSKEPAWPVDPGSRVAPHGLSSDLGLKLDSVSGGPPSRGLHSYHASGNLHLKDARERELPVGIHDNSKGRAERDHANRDFIGPGSLGHPPHDFRGSSSGPRGREEIDCREARSFGYSWRSEFDAPESTRFGEHIAPGPPHDQLRRGDLFGQDVPPSHLRRGEFQGPVNSLGHLRLGDTAGFGPFPGHPQMGELSGPSNLPPNLHFSESFAGNKPGLPRLGEPGFRSSFSLQSFPNGPYAGDMDLFDNSRKRKPVSMGWCRICKVDCETVDGLDVHSQTRDHQKMAMDMVMSIKKQNRKKQKVSNDRALREEASRMRIAGLEGRGNKP